VTRDWVSLATDNCLPATAFRWNEALTLCPYPLTLSSREERASTHFVIPSGACIHPFCHSEERRRARLFISAQAGAEETAPLLLSVSRRLF
jgi:hypothetical protein